MNKLRKKELKQIIEDYAENGQELQEKLLEYLHGQQSEKQTLSQTRPISEMVQEEIEQIKSRSVSDVFFRSNFKSLDAQTGGFQYGELVALAGRPGVGFPAFMASMAINISREHPVLYYALHQSAPEITRTLMSALREVRFDASLSPDDYQKRSLLEKAASQLQEYHLFINTLTTPNFRDFKVQLIKDLDEKQTRIVFVDYLQIFSSYTSRSQRDLEISHICAELKRIAMDYQAGIFLCSQLSRNVEYRPNKIPMMHDLRDSGSIEELCDKVILLYRPSYYGIEADNEGNDVSDLLELHLVKNNSGNTVVIPLKVNANLTAVKDFEGFSEGLHIDALRSSEVNEMAYHHGLSQLNDEDTEPLF
jgi:replicative DNA helicase